VTATSFCTSVSTKRSIASSAGRFLQSGRFGSALNGMAFTFARNPRISFASATASAGASL
jgi:hypothetical protein